jgi:hypothetical protein
MRTNVYKLVYSTHAPKYGPIANSDMSGHLRIVAHNAVVTHNTIMRQVAVSHYQTVFPNHGLLLILCSPIHSYVLTNSCIVADNHNGVFTLKFHILRYRRNDRTRKYPAILSYACTLHDCHTRPNPCAIANFNVLVNNGKWVNLYICRELCIRMNIRVRMNHAGFLQQKSHVIKRDVQK